MERDEADELGELLRYPEDTAGGTMTTEFVAVPADLSAAATIDRLRELEPDAETIYYVYVVDAAERLVGVLSLRDLIVAPPASPVGEVMIPDPVAVDVLADRDEVAAVVARYNLLAVPVVDEERRLVGIVTVDDAMDTILPAGWRRRLPRRRRARLGLQGPGPMRRPPPIALRRPRPLSRLRDRLAIGRRVRLRGRFRGRRGLLAFLAVMGPGLIAGIAGNDAGGITTYSVHRRGDRADPAVALPDHHRRSWPSSRRWRHGSAS